MAELDQITLATYNYIKKCLDKLFQTHPWGYDPEEDEFRDWVMQVRREHGHPTPPKASGGGQ